MQMIIKYRIRWFGIFILIMGCLQGAAHNNAALYKLDFNTQLSDADKATLQSDGPLYRNKPQRDFLNKVRVIPLNGGMTRMQNKDHGPDMMAGSDSALPDTADVLIHLPEAGKGAALTKDAAHRFMDQLTYPELIPVVKNGLFGYCDRDLNIKIDSQFEQAGFFETDFSFQICNVTHPEIVQFGTDDYAWVETLDNKRCRIDKHGNVVYHYKESDFISDAPFISLYESEDFKVTGVDRATLLQIINGSATIDDPVFFNKTGIDTLQQKGTGTAPAGMLIICFTHRDVLPLSYFRDEKTQLQGIKNRNTGKILIEAKYTMLDKQFDDDIKLNWYPLLLAYSPDDNRKFYVGLDGKEYIIR